MKVRGAAALKGANDLCLVRFEDQGLEVSISKRILAGWNLRLEVRIQALRFRCESRGWEVSLKAEK